MTPIQVVTLYAILSTTEALLLLLYRTLVVVVGPVEMLTTQGESSTATARGVADRASRALWRGAQFQMGHGSLWRTRLIKGQAVPSCPHLPQISSAVHVGPHEIHGLSNAPLDRQPRSRLGRPGRARQLAGPPEARTAPLNNTGPRFRDEGGA